MMVLAAVVLLGLILLVLIGILLTCSNSLNDLRKYAEWIHSQLAESKQSLEFLANKIGELNDNVNNIYHVATDIKFQQENLEKYKIDKTIDRLQNIELILSDLNDTLSSLERSLDIIVDHPAFTVHDDDPL